ncbi:MAG: PEP-CTERM sorting domain-containing protein [Lentisphaeria bacterium]
MHHHASLLSALALALAAASGQAALVTDAFRYNGSYTPTSASPPAGQSTWSYGTAALAVVPNNPAAGIALFADSRTDARIQMNHLYGDAAFIAAPAAYEWEYAITFKVNSFVSTGQPFLVGVRDEGGNGKAVIFSMSVSAGNSLYFTNAAGNGDLGLDKLYSGTTILNDGLFHTIRIVKQEIGGVMKVTGSVDGTQTFQANYSTFQDDSGMTNGFGFFGSTPSMYNLQIDDLYFGAPVPEPAGLALAGLGLAALLRRRGARSPSPSRLP